MIHRLKSVSIRQLPEKLGRNRERLFFRNLKSAMNVVRPAVVLDCSTLPEMDAAAIHLLLCCLEEAMKRNGDIRLAALSPGARRNLQLAGVDRLFRIFSNTGDAVESFQRRTPLAVHHAPANKGIGAECAA